MIASALRAQRVFRTSECRSNLESRGPSRAARFFVALLAGLFLLARARALGAQPTSPPSAGDAQPAPHPKPEQTPPEAAGASTDVKHSAGAPGVPQAP